MIYFKDVIKSYPIKIGEASKKKALHSVSFSIEKGSTVSLVGQNGAGKSTIIKLIMGYISPDKGSIDVLGFDPMDGESRRKIGYLPEVASFPPNVTGNDIIEFSGRCAGMSKKDIFEKSEFFLESLDIKDAAKRSVNGYSKGMKQRLSFVTALIHNPELIILDEPMSGLDPLGRELIINLISSMKKEGKTILFCSHLLDDVEKITNNIIVLDKGIVLYEGTCDYFKESLHENSLQDSFISKIKSQGNYS